MLVLSRRPQQSLLIGHDVVVTVLEVNGDTVRIGITAPPEIDIHREEVYLDLMKSNVDAAGAPGAAAALSRRMRAKPAATSARKASSARGPLPEPAPPPSSARPPLPTSGPGEDTTAPG